MSDIASPILAVMDNEAHAFICFCGIMKRLEGNFRPDGQLMSIKFQHLKLLLQYSDPEFYSYLVSRGADDLFFCYRWLLLELKREFAFDDALRMLEVTWSSFPPDPPETEVDLLGPTLESNETMSCRDMDMTVESCLEDEKEQKEKQRRRHMLRPSREESEVSRNIVVEESVSGGSGCDIPQGAMENEDVITNPFERQTSFGEFKYYSARSEENFDGDNAEQPQSSRASKLIMSSQRRQSTVDSEEDPGEKTPLIKNLENGLSPKSSPSIFPNGLPIWKTGPFASPMSSAASFGWPSSSPDSSPKSPSQSTTNGEEAFSRTVPEVLTSSSQALGNTGLHLPTIPTVRKPVLSPSHTQTPSLLSSPILLFGRGQSLSGTANSSKSETLSTKPCSLPPPQEFGKGNPFMLFLCLSILLEHRDHIIKNCFDYNELAMHFDRLVRRHNLNRVLQRAKALFADYLQSEVWDSEEGDEVSSDSPTTSAAQHSPSNVFTRPIYSPLASPQSSSPCSTYNLARTIPVSAAQVYIAPTP